MMPAYAPALHATCDERIAALRRINEQQAERIAELEVTMEECQGDFDAISLGNAGKDLAGGGRDRCAASLTDKWAESPLLSHVRCARQIRLQRERIAELEATQERRLRAAYSHGLNRGRAGRGKTESEAVAYVMQWGR